MLPYQRTSFSSKQMGQQTEKDRQGERQVRKLRGGKSIKDKVGMRLILGFFFQNLVCSRGWAKVTCSDRWGNQLFPTPRQDSTGWTGGRGSDRERKYYLGLPSVVSMPSRSHGLSVLLCAHCVFFNYIEWDFVQFHTCTNMQQLFLISDNDSMNSKCVRLCVWASMHARLCLWQQL